MWFVRPIEARIPLGAHASRRDAERWLARQLESPTDALGRFRTESLDQLLYGEVTEGAAYIGLLRRSARVGQLLLHGELVEQGGEWYLVGQMRSGRHQRVNLTAMGLFSVAISAVLPLAHLRQQGLADAFTAGAAMLLFAPFVLTAVFLWVLSRIGRGGQHDLSEIHAALSQAPARLDDVA